jgi:hypothetical protein
LHVCNLLSFEVSANVMTMACVTPKRNRLGFEFLFQTAIVSGTIDQRESSR